MRVPIRDRLIEGRMLWDGPPGVIRIIDGSANQVLANVYGLVTGLALIRRFMRPDPPNVGRVGVRWPRWAAVNGWAEGDWFAGDILRVTAELAQSVHPRMTVVTWAEERPSAALRASRWRGSCQV